MKDGVRVARRTGMSWLGVVLGLVGLQAGLIAWLSDRSEWVTTERPATMAVRLDRVSPTVPIADPTLLALPSGAGFAGSAWRQASRPRYESRGWSEGPAWLGAREAPLGRSLLETRRPEIGRGLTAEKPVPDLVRREVRPVRLPERTLVRLEGELARLEPMTALTAAALTHSNILTETVVELTVHPDGQVLSAIVLKSAGLRAADERALELARAMRFVPRVWGDARSAELDVDGDDESGERGRVGTDSRGVLGGEWVRGKMTVQWRTVGPGPAGTVER
jgi:TonB family protein